MEDFRKRVEKNLGVPNLPQFSNKEEILEHARARLAAKRGRSAPGSVQGTASVGSDTEDSIRRDQGNGGGGTADRIRADAEGGTQAYPLYAGDGRDAAGARGSNGHSYQSTIGNRVDADGRISFNKYDGSTGGVSEPAVHADKGKRKSGGFRSRVKSFTDAAFAPIEQAPKSTKSPKSSASAPSSGGKKWRVLTNAEADELRPRLIQYLTWQSEHADDFIMATTVGHQPVVIWSNMDDAEIEIVADFLIARGKKDVRVAEGVRLAAEILDRIKVAFIVLPRAYQTINTYFSRGFDVKIFVRPRR